MEWKELYHDLVKEMIDLKKEVRLLRMIRHTDLPIMEEDKDGMEGTI